MDKLRKRFGVQNATSFQDQDEEKSRTNRTESGGDRSRSTMAGKKRLEWKKGHKRTGYINEEGAGKRGGKRRAGGNLPPQKNHEREGA